MLKLRKRHRFAFKLFEIEDDFHGLLRIIITKILFRPLCKVVGYDLETGDLVALDPHFGCSGKTYNRFQHKRLAFDSSYRQYKTDYTPHWYGHSTGGKRINKQDFEKIIEIFLQEPPLAEMVTSKIPHIRRIGLIIQKHQEQCV